jgi:hypothetical protein
VLRGRQEVKTQETAARTRQDSKLKIQDLFSSPAHDVNCSIYMFRRLAVIFLCDKVKRGQIQIGAEVKNPQSKHFSFFRTLAKLNAIHKHMVSTV